MKGFLLIVACLTGFASFFRVGFVEAEREIQATCDSEDQPTIINGTPYVCLSPAQAAKLYRALQQRGA